MTLLTLLTGCDLLVLYERQPTIKDVLENHLIQISAKSRLSIYYRIPVPVLHSARLISCRW